MEPESIESLKSNAAVLIGSYSLVNSSKGKNGQRCAQLIVTLNAAAENAHGTISDEYMVLMTRILGEAFTRLAPGMKNGTGEITDGKLEPITIGIEGRNIIFSYPKDFWKQNPDCLDMVRNFLGQEKEKFSPKLRVEGQKQVGVIDNDAKGRAVGE